jgi:hypothetical protein
MVKEVIFEQPNPCTDTICIDLTKNQIKIKYFSVFNCIVYEHEKPSNYIYTAQNNKTKETYPLTKRKTPVTEENLPALAEKIHHSPIAGYGRYLIDRSYGETLPNKTAFEILKLYNSKNHIYTAMSNQKTLILETQDGITECLLPAIIIKRGRINDFKLSTEYGDMPIVIGTPDKGKIQRQIDKLSLGLKIIVVLLIFKEATGN